MSNDAYYSWGLYYPISEWEDEITCDISMDVLTVDLAESLEDPELHDEITCNLWKDRVEVDLCLSQV